MRKQLWIGLSLVSTCIVAGSCSSSGGGGSTVEASSQARTTSQSAAAVSPSSAAASGTPSLPASIRAAGAIKVALNPTYPPFAFADNGGAPSGVEADLFNAMAKVLGTQVDYSQVPFASILTSVTSGRVDVGLGGFFDTDEREKQATFVDYGYALDGLIVAKGNPSAVKASNLCGRSVGAAQGSYEDTNLEALSGQCKANGKKAIDIHVFQGTPPQLTALASGRIEASDVGQAVGRYVIRQQQGKFTVLSDPVPDAHGVKNINGMVVSRKNTALAKAMADALNAVIANGEYAAIMKKWGLSEGAIDAAEINKSPVASK